MYRSALVAALWAAPLFAQADKPAPVAATPTLKLPPQIMGDPGAFVRVAADTNCKRIRWRCDGVTRCPAEWLKDPDKAFVFMAPPGTYRVTAEGTLNDEWAEASCLVIIGQQPIPPVPPGPGPQPPGPPPAGLAAELQLLYTADADPQKAAYREKLLSLWSGVSRAALADPTLATRGALTTKMYNAGKEWPYSLTDANLATVRGRLAKEITDKLGPADTPLDDTKRKLASALFGEFVAALQQVK